VSRTLATTPTSRHSRRPTTVTLSPRPITGIDSIDSPGLELDTDSQQGEGKGWTNDNSTGPVSQADTHEDVVMSMLDTAIVDAHTKHNAHNRAFGGNIYPTSPLSPKLGSHRDRDRSPAPRSRETAQSSESPSKQNTSRQSCSPSRSPSPGSPVDYKHKPTNFNTETPQFRQLQQAAQLLHTVISERDALKQENKELLAQVDELRSQLLLVTLEKDELSVQVELLDHLCAQR
jgi:hypothetical protein